MQLDPQLKLAFIDRHVEKDIIEQRITDGYINATHLCSASGKQIGHYFENQTTKQFLIELSSEIGIPISSLVQIIKGGDPRIQGTWVHPQVAINMGQWASPKFAVFISKWVFEWMSGNIPGKEKLPYHIRRYLINRSEIPYTHFSVFNEIVLNLIAPLEDFGYELPDNLVPDISQGKMFARWVREEMGMEPNDFRTYTHTYPDGRKIDGVKLYPNALLAAFRKHFVEVWLRERAIDYFRTKDSKALPYLESVIRALPEPPRILFSIDPELKGLLNVPPEEK
jgi:hypothetical protein